MLEITTAKQPLNKVKIDGFVYSVRKPGAGESYFLSQAQRNIKKLTKKIEDKTVTDAEQAEYENITMKALKVSVTLFDALGDDKAQDYLDRLDAEILFNVIGQVYDKLNETEPTEPAPKELPKAQ